MAAGRFQIDITRVQKMINELSDCDDRMRDAQKRLKKVGPKALGTDDLDDACDNFQGQWSDGIKRIADASKDIRDRLQTTVDAYQAGEEHNDKMFHAKGV